LLEHKAGLKKLAYFNILRKLSAYSRPNHGKEHHVLSMYTKISKYTSNSSSFIFKELSKEGLK